MCFLIGLLIYILLYTRGISKRKKYGSTFVFEVLRDGNISQKEKKRKQLHKVEQFLALCKELKGGGNLFLARLLF